MKLGNFFSEKGGELTLYMMGKIERPSREPLYSQGSREMFPIPPKYEIVGYYDFIRSHIKNSNHILISQSLRQNSLCGIFASHKELSYDPMGYGRRKNWWRVENYDELCEMIRHDNQRGLHVYSLVANDTTGMFGAFSLEGYGSGQKISHFDPSDVPGFRTVDTVVNLLSVCRQDLGNGEVTSITSKGSTYYIVMTSNALDYHGRGQTYFTCRNWSDVDLHARLYSKSRLLIAVFVFGKLCV